VGTASRGDEAHAEKDKQQRDSCGGSLS